MTNQTNPDLPWMVEAKRLLGTSEIKSTNSSPTIDAWIMDLCNSKTVPTWLKSTPWCGTFVAHCLKKAGFSRGEYNSRNSIAKQAVKAFTYPFNWWGAGEYRVEGGRRLSRPCYGCVAVKTRKGGNHVCFVAGVTKDGFLVCLGGNQSNMVCYAKYKASDFDSFMWYGKTFNPSELRYSLPLIERVSLTTVTES